MCLGGWRGRPYLRVAAAGRGQGGLGERRCEAGSGGREGYGEAGSMRREGIIRSETRGRGNRRSERNVKAPGSEREGIVTLEAQGRRL